MQEIEAARTWRAKRNVNGAFFSCPVNSVGAKKVSRKCERRLSEARRSESLLHHFLPMNVLSLQIQGIQASPTNPPLATTRMSAELDPKSSAHDMLGSNLCTTFKYRHSGVANQRCCQHCYRRATPSRFAKGGMKENVRFHP